MHLRFPAWLAVLSLVGVRFAAPARADPAEAPPLHPTAIVCTYEGSPCQVTAVNATVGVVQYKGKPTRIGAGVPCDAVRASAFLPGQVTISDINTVSNTRTKRMTLGYDQTESTTPVNSEFSATLVSTRSYPDCFFVIIAFDQQFLAGTSDAPSITFALQEIGPIAANTKTTLHTFFPFVNLNGRTIVDLPLVFSRGVEIRSNQADSEAAFFRRVEMIRHKKLVDLYLEKNVRESRGVSPYLRFSPIFPDDLDPASLPAGLKVTSRVSWDGTVNDLSVSPEVPPAVLAGVRRALMGWLYLPKLENGVARPATSTIELSFPKPASAAPKASGG